jgi:hypothetical protein
VLRAVRRDIVQWREYGLHSARRTGEFCSCVQIETWVLITCVQVGSGEVVMSRPEWSMNKSNSQSNDMVRQPSTKRTTTLNSSSEAQSTATELPPRLIRLSKTAASAASDSTASSTNLPPRQRRGSISAAADGEDLSPPRRAADARRSGTPESSPRRLAPPSAADGGGARRPSLSPADVCALCEAVSAAGGRCAMHTNQVGPPLAALRSLCIRLPGAQPPFRPPSRAHGPIAALRRSAGCDDPSHPVGQRQPPAGSHHHGRRRLPSARERDRGMGGMGGGSP